MTAADWFDSVAERRPDHTAIIYGEQILTYENVRARTVSAAAALQAHGVTKGDRVAWLGPNNPAGIELPIATARVGAIFVPLNNRLTVPEHKYQLEHCGVSVLCTHPSFAAHAAEVGPRLQLIEISDYLEGGNTTVAPPTQSPDDPALLVFTSGTTGKPKGAVHSHATFEAAADNGIACQDITEDDVVLATLPLFHVGGLNIQTLPALKVGATVILQQAFSPQSFIDDVVAHRPTVSIAVPAMIRSLIEHPDWPMTDFSCLRGMTLGSSVVPEDLIRALLAAGIPVGQVYGSTETGPTTVALRFEDSDQVGSCGKPVPGTESRTIETGELMVRGANVFSGYWNDADATASSFSDGWFHTGDVATIDSSGYHRIIDRVKDVIISGGENIYPTEVEAVLAEVPGVNEITVVGRPDRKWGERPVAFVVASDGSTPTIGELRSYGEQRLARFKLPVEMHLIDALPRTALGKVQKFELVLGLTD